MANSYGWPDPKVTYNKNAKKIADARAARAAQVAQLHYPMPQAPVSPSMPPMGQPPMGQMGMQQPQTMAPPALPTGSPWPPVPGFRSGGYVRFDDGGTAEEDDRNKPSGAAMFGPGAQYFQNYQPPSNGGKEFGLGQILGDFARQDAETAATRPPWNDSGPRTVGGGGNLLANLVPGAPVPEPTWNMPQLQVAPGMWTPQPQVDPNASALQLNPDGSWSYYDERPKTQPFRAGGIVRFDDGGDVELTDEEKQRQAIANAGNIPVPAPAIPPGGALAGSVGDTLGQAPVYGPPAPTYLQAAQQVYAQNPELVSIAAGELQQNNGIANIQQYQQQLAQQQAQQQQYEARQAGTTQVNPNQGGARGPENPPNVQPGPNADMGILDVGKIQQQYDKVNPSIPYVTPAIENYVKPAAGFAIEHSFPGLAAIQAAGGPNVGQAAANMTIPSHALDLALTAAPFAGEAASAGRGALENAAVKGLDFKPQGLEALGGREAAAVQLKSGVPAGAALTPQEGAQLRAQAEAAGLTAADWQHSSVLQDQYGRMGADGAVARAKQALEAIGERTVGSPSEVLKRYDNAGAQIFPELGEAQHRVNNMAGNAYQDMIAKGGSLEDAKAAAAKAAATQQEVERGAVVQPPEDQLSQQLQGSLQQKGITPPAEVAPPLKPALDDAAINTQHEAVRNAAPDQMVTVYRGDSPEAAASMRANGTNPDTALATDPETAMLFAQRISDNPVLMEFQVPRSQLTEKDWYFTANEGVKPTEAPNLQNPTPAQGSLYHGTGSKFEAFDDTGATANQTALFGPGTYLTDNRDIAHGYAINGERRVTQQNASVDKAFSGMTNKTEAARQAAELKVNPEATIHSVQVRPDMNLLDLESPAPANVVEHLRQQAEANGNGFDADAWDLAAKAAVNGEPAKGIYSAFKDGLIDAGATKADAGEALGALSDSLHGIGYDGLTHTGGIHGGAQHNVTILFDANEAKIVGSEAARSASPTGTPAPVGSGAQRAAQVAAEPGYSQTQRDFFTSGNGQAAATQREAAANVGVRPGETTSVTTGGAPTTATGGVGQPPTGTGGTGIPPTGGAGATPLKPQNPIQQTINIISMPTQTRLLGGHFLRQGEGMAVTHPKEAIDALRAGFREFTKPGQANQITKDIWARSELLPEGDRLKDVRGTFGPRMEKGIGDKLLGQIPLFDRLRGFGTTYLNTLRDGAYVTTAERHLRMDPEAPPEALKAVYNTFSHQSGHPTLKGNVREAMGSAQGLGVGWGALTARVQHFGDILLAPGSPLPWSPTAKGEAVRGLLGNIGTMIASTTAASYLGAKVNIPFLGGNRDLTNPYGIKTDFFKPVTTTPDLAYKTVYGTGGSGYDSIIRLFGNAAIDLASQNFTGKNSLESHILNWARGEAGVAPSVLIDLISGSTYNGKPYDLDKLKEEASHGFWERVAPIAAESMIKAYGAWGPEGLARAAPSLGAWEVQTTPTTKTNQGNALLDSDQRNQLLGPTLAPLVKPGEDFNALGSREKEAIHAGMNPDALKAERDQKIKDGDKVAIAQFQREDIKNSYQPAFQKLDEALHNGTYTPYEARQLVNATERQMYEKMNAVKFPEGNKDYTPSPIQKAEEGYRGIYDALPKGTNGKPDYEQLQKAQQSYMANIGRSDPELMQRLAANVLPRVNPNDSNIQKMYDQPQMKQAVQAYNQQDDGAKTGWRIENPSQNALLYSGGYVRTLDTPAALQAYKVMGIAGDPEVNFMVGFTKDTATPYSRIQAGSLQPQLQAYQGLNASREEGDFRAQAYLKEHPALNALLWQTGHTSHVYSVPAYESITGHHEAPLASNPAPLRSEVPAPAPLRPQAMAAPITGTTLPPVVSNDSQQRQNFVQAMSVPASQYAETTKIPPAVWAAMGASESNWGRAPSVFGIKGTGTAGGADLATHEIINGQRVNMNDQFAAYNTLDDAFKHFVDLTSSGRYADSWNHLQQTGNWEDFLHGINKAGYATAPNWADSIISLTKHIQDNYGLR